LASDGQVPLDRLHPTGQPLLELVAIMDRLRSPGGCPWDAQQTHSSLVSYLIEETYEAVEAIEAGDSAGMCEELGDLLLQVVFHARIAAEDPRQPWNIDDVAAGISSKLMARHPHVFGDVVADTAEEVAANWASLKVTEKARDSVLDGIPAGLPALVLAEKMTHRAAAAGVVPGAGPTAALLAAESAMPAGTTFDGFGELLLALVIRGQGLGLDAEAALRHATRAHAGRIRAAERERRVPGPSGSRNASSPLPSKSQDG
jgi:XTP/dITP diphosphohydrolase